MRRSHYRRTSKWPTWLSGRRRIVAAAATLVAFGGIVGVTQVSNASTETKKALAACDGIQAPKATKLSSETKKGTYTTNNGKVTQHSDDGATDVPSAAQMRTRCRDWVMQNAGNSSPAPATSAGTKADGQQGGATAPPPGAGLGILTNSCDTSKLQPHDGFQNGNRCVSTEFGEVGSQENNPSLLITEAPEQVAAGTPFTLKVSTRNLIRDRFLAAGAGGYYVESSVLQDGIVRGHFHTACRMLAGTNEAPAPDPVPAFFVATEDKKGGRTPDEVTIQVAGMPTAGTAQCASWAGDGSHRVPMMQRANQTPAFDVVRINVTGGGANNGGGNAGNGQAGNGNGQAGNGNAGNGQAGNGGNTGNAGNGQTGNGQTGNGQNGNGQNGNGQNGNGGATTAPTTAPPATGGQGQGQTKQPTTRTTIVKPAPTTKAAVEPTKAPTTEAPTTKAPTTEAPTTKAPTTKATTKAATNSDNGVSSTDDETATVETTKAPTAKAAPAKTKASTEAAGNYTYDNGDDGAPDPDQPKTVVAEPQADTKAGNKLALTGSNTIAVVGGGVVLVLIGLVVLSSTRRRRARSSSDYY